MSQSKNNSISITNFYEINLTQFINFPMSGSKDDRWQEYNYTIPNGTGVSSVTATLHYTQLDDFVYLYINNNLILEGDRGPCAGKNASCTMYYEKTETMNISLPNNNLNVKILLRNIADNGVLSDCWYTIRVNY